MDMLQMDTRGYKMDVVEPNVMRGLQPAGATRVTLDVLSRLPLFLWSVPGAFRLVTTLRLTCGPAANRTTTVSLAQPTTPEGRLLSRLPQA